MQEDQIDKFFEEHANENGEIDPEKMSRFLNGEEFEASETAGGEPVAEESLTPATEDQQKEEPEPEKEEPVKEAAEPVVLAKDGENVIPYSVLEDLRGDKDELKKLVSSKDGELEELRGKLQELQQAKEDDAESGTTEATDELLEELEEDYPGITKKLHARLLADIQPEIEALKADREQREKMSAEQQAQAAFERSVLDLEPDYDKIKSDPSFWDWFDKQPSYVKAAENSGDPQMIADVIKAYKETATGSDKPDAKDNGKVEPKADPVATAKGKVDKAGENPAISTLSDVPGGSNPIHDEVAAMDGMSGQQLLGKMEGWSPDKIEDYLLKTL